MPAILDGHVYLIKKCKPKKDNSNAFVNQCDGTACKQLTVHGIVKEVFETPKDSIWFNPDYWYSFEPAVVAKTMYDSENQPQEIKVIVHLYGEEATAINDIRSDRLNGVYERYNNDPDRIAKIMKEIEDAWAESESLVLATGKAITEEQALRNAVEEFNALRPGYNLVFESGYEAFVKCTSSIGEVYLLWQNCD